MAKVVIEPDAGENITAVCRAAAELIALGHSITFTFNGTKVYVRDIAHAISEIWGLQRELLQKKGEK